MANINYPHLASMVFNTPLMCTPTLLDSVKQALLPRLTGAATDIAGAATDVAMVDPRYAEFDTKTVDLRTSGGVVVLPVHGILTTRRGNIDAQCMEIASYEELSSLLDVALNSSAVEHIVLDLNTPGGAATGCFDFAERIYQARDIKPITAVVNYSAYSAGYMIASACTDMALSMTAGVGSIGVIAAHVDLSQMLEADGIKITTFYRGDHKNDLSPYGPLTDQAAVVLNERLDELYAMFVDTVARNRGLTTAAVRDTQAGLFMGKKAIAAGLADKLMYPQDAVDQIAAGLAERKRSSKPKAGRVGMQAAAMQMQIQQ